MKPKLSLQSGEEECPAPTSPKSPSNLEGNFGFSRQGSGSSAHKGSETFVTTKVGLHKRVGKRRNMTIISKNNKTISFQDITEFRSKIHSRNSFENENYRGVGATKMVTLVPDIMVSCPSGRNSSEDIKQVSLFRRIMAAKTAEKLGDTRMTRSREERTLLTDELSPLMKPNR